MVPQVAFIVRSVMSAGMGEQVIEFEYVLKNDQGDILDKSDGEPMAFLTGHNNIIDGLEKAILRHSSGDEFEVEILPSEGYGEIADDSLVQLPRESFPKEFEPVVGQPVILEDEHGHPVTAWIQQFDEQKLTFDLNHPLAGERLHFWVRVGSSRAPEKEELEHGHPHGPGGHHH